MSLHDAFLRVSKSPDVQWRMWKSCVNHWKREQCGDDVHCWYHQQVPVIRRPFLHSTLKRSHLSVILYNRLTATAYHLYHYVMNNAKRMNLFVFLMQIWRRHYYARSNFNTDVKNVPSRYAPSSILPSLALKHAFRFSLYDIMILWCISSVYWLIGFIFWYCMAIDQMSQ